MTYVSVDVEAMIGNMCGSEGKNLVTRLGRDVSPNTGSWVYLLVNDTIARLDLKIKNCLQGHIHPRAFTFGCIWVACAARESTRILMCI